MDKREPITASNLGPVDSVLAWVVEAAVILAVGIKFTLSYIIPGKRHAEDTALFLATVFSIGFTVAISFAIPNGVGKHQQTLSSHQLESLKIGVYAADILLVLVSTCVQASVLIFLRDLTPNRVHKRWMNAVAVSVTLFFIASFFTALFPCRPPRVWEFLGVDCIDQLSFWEAFAGINIVIEVSLVLFPILIVYPLHMGKTRKVLLISCFASRLVVITTFAIQIYEAQHLKLNLYDFTFHSWRYFLTVVFVQGLSIVTACIPSIRNLLLGMESGMIQTGHVRLPDRNQDGREYPLNIITIGQISSNLSKSTDAQVERPALSHE